MSNSGTFAMSFGGHKYFVVRASVMIGVYGCRHAFWANDSTSRQTRHIDMLGPT